MALAAVPSKAVVLLLLIYCVFVASIGCGSFVLSPYFVVFCGVLSSWAITLLRTRELVAFL